MTDAGMTRRGDHARLYPLETSVEKSYTARSHTPGKQEGKHIFSIKTNN